MANRRAAFTQSDLTKVLKAFQTAGYPPPVIVIEHDRITAKPGDLQESGMQTGWEDCQ